MKPEKGKPVFSDDVDTVLTEKIVEHTQKNTDTSDHNKSDPFSFSPSQKNGCCKHMSKSKCIPLCIALALIIAGIIAFFIFKRLHLH